MSMKQFVIECLEYQAYHEQRDKRRPRWCNPQFWRWISFRKMPSYRAAISDIYECVYVMRYDDTIHVKLMYQSAWGDWRLMSLWRIDGHTLVIADDMI